MIVKAVRAFFDGTSRMNREVQVRICEGLGGEVPWVYSVIAELVLPLAHIRLTAAAP